MYVLWEEKNGIKLGVLAAVAEVASFKPPRSFESPIVFKKSMCILHFSSYLLPYKNSSLLPQIFK